MRDLRVILGAPGCGKTTRLMNILEEELLTHDPREVAFVSFTRKGTYEGSQRAMARFGKAANDLPYFRTLHSIAFREGKFSKYDMISKQDYREFSKTMGMKFTGYYTEDFFGEDDRYLFAHFLKRNNPSAAEEYTAKLSAFKLKEVEENFVGYKVFAKIVDFTDIIERFIGANKPLPVKVAIIDEAQDLTSLQWSMCEVAFRDCERVYIAGDDDQAIYEWSGADVEHFLKLAENASSVEVLSKSYRLSDAVLTAAKKISAQIAQRAEKVFAPTGSSGQVILYNSIAEVPIPPAGTSCYLLSRNRWFLQKLAGQVRRAARVWTQDGKLSYLPADIEAINIYEKSRRGKAVSDMDLAKVSHLLREGRKIDGPWWESLDIGVESAVYYRDLIRTHADLNDRSITVSTIHGVKGGEADEVILLTDFTRAVQMGMEKNPDSELRCLYVAMTRARNKLHIVHSEKTGYDEYVRFK